MEVLVYRILLYVLIFYLNLLKWILLVVLIVSMMRIIAFMMLNSTTLLVLLQALV